MGTSNLFNAASSVKEVRDVTAGYTLEILGYFFPTDEVKELQAQYEAGTADTEIPSGAAAVNFEAVTPETKTALLIAQAAERTARLADLGEQFAAGHTTFLELEKTPGFEENGGKDLGHKDFQWVGSEKDAPELQHAQGVMMAAQAYLNNELHAIDGAVNNPAHVDNRQTIGIEPAYGLKQNAAELYTVAAGLLAAEGHDDISDKLNSVAATVQAEAPEGSWPTPPAAMGALRFNSLEGAKQLAISLGPEYLGEDEPYLSHIEKITGLVSDEGGLQTASVDTKPKGP